MKDQKKSIVPLLIIIVAAIIIVGGIYLYRNNKSTEQNSLAANGGTSVSDQSNAEGTTGVSNDTSVTILNPTAGETFSPGEVVDITWTGLRRNFVMYLTNQASNAQFHSVATIATVSNTSAEEYQWTVPNVALTWGTHGYGISFVFTDVPNDVTQSPQFSILGAPTTTIQTSLKVLNPQGGEIFHTGQTVSVQWKATGISTVYLSLVHGGADLGHLTTQGLPATQGTFLWTVPDASQFPAGQGGGYEILIDNNGSLQATSPAFTITK